MSKEKRNPDEEPKTLTEFIRAIFEVGFKAGENGQYTDFDDALDDDKVAEKVEKAHEEFGSGVLAVVETMLDMEEDDEEDDDGDGK